MYVIIFDTSTYSYAEYQDIKYSLEFSIIVVQQNRSISLFSVDCVFANFSHVQISNNYSAMRIFLIRKSDQRDKKEYKQKKNINEKENAESYFRSFGMARISMQCDAPTRKRILRDDL